MNKIMINIIRFYKNHISICFQKSGIKCKFYPTCSEYAIQAYKKYGFFRGTVLATKRIIKCNPFSKGGYDPLK